MDKKKDQENPHCYREEKCMYKRAKTSTPWQQEFPEVCFSPLNLYLLTQNL